MKKLAICFSLNGAKIIDRINEACAGKDITPLTAYALTSSEEIPDGFTRVESDVYKWTSDNFIEGNALIFVGAAGIAVRALSGLPKDKLSDCPVIVIDDAGSFVIGMILPILPPEFFQPGSPVFYAQADAVDIISGVRLVFRAFQAEPF